MSSASFAQSLLLPVWHLKCSLPSKRAKSGLCEVVAPPCLVYNGWKYLRQLGGCCFVVNCFILKQDFLFYN